MYKQMVYFTNNTDLSQNNFNNCSMNHYILELSGIEGVDWELDPSIDLGSSISGSNILVLNF